MVSLIKGNGEGPAGRGDAGAHRRGAGCRCDRGDLWGEKRPGSGGLEAGMDPTGDWLGALAGDPLLCLVLLRRVGQLDPWPFLPVFQ